MNLQNLRSELNARAEEAATREPDLLPGVRNKIRRTKQRRTAGALASVAAVAALAVAIVPGVLNTTTPDPADPVPSDYVKDGQTVPGTVNGDKLLKAWIGDKNQSKFSFAWTPTTNKIAIYASCDALGYAAPKEVRVWIGDWYAGSTGCRGGSVQSETLRLGSFDPDAALWLDSPVGKSATVSAEVVGSDSGKAETVDQLQLGIYAASDQPLSADETPRRIPAVGPDDFQSNGVVYRKHFGGDTLLGATVGRSGQKKVQLSFTSTGGPLVLHEFCTANKSAGGTGLPPYEVTTSLNGELISKATCGAASTDGLVGNSHGVASSPPAGQRVDLVSEIVALPGKQAPPLPADVRLGTGVYQQGKQRLIDGTALAEHIEMGGYEYRLAEVRTAKGPAGRVSIKTPADQQFAIAYGSSKLGIPGPAEAMLYFRDRTTGISTSVEQDGLGDSKMVFSAGPAGQAEMKVTKGKPTKGTLLIAIYLPI
ncbi:hypothetical protein E1263_24190 [Kribbella antibiotica]|uniref:Uncharacterized protein n=1 Tax=Kribbella antibiotica TaxID=190195 RepID=A0A4R4ZH17_9ACTN|nr:hypothetical protein [Kribbella antibiotica]TDD57336.1 hypothetical protein E1263_24190 [Kribbella antibiotica]